MELIIDIQGLKISSTKFIFKELAVIVFNGSDTLMTYLFKPPCNWNDLSVEAQNENIWLRKNHHGLEWYSGEIPYYELNAMLEKIANDFNHPVVYVKGLQKKKLLEPYFTDIRNLEDYDCPNLRQCIFTNDKACSHHPQQGTWHCATKHVCTLKKWLQWKRTQDTHLTRMERK